MTLQEDLHVQDNNNDDGNEFGMKTSHFGKQLSHVQLNTSIRHLVPQ